MTNSVDQTAAKQRFEALGLGPRLKVIEISKLLAGAIVRLHLGAPDARVRAEDSKVERFRWIFMDFPCFFLTFHAFLFIFGRFLVVCGDFSSVAARLR